MCQFCIYVTLLLLLPLFPSYLFHYQKKISQLKYVYIHMYMYAACIYTKNITNISRCTEKKLYKYNVRARCLPLSHSSPGYSFFLLFRFIQRFVLPAKLCICICVWVCVWGSIPMRLQGIFWVLEWEECSVCRMYISFVSISTFLIIRDCVQQRQHPCLVSASEIASC